MHAQFSRGTAIRRFPISWSKTFTLLGFKWKPKRRKSHRVRGRRSRIEPLEARHMLAVLMVNSTADNTTASDGLVTLREAIAAANNNTTTDLGQTGNGTDTITFDPHVFDSPQTITLGSQLTISSSLSIEGPGSELLSISGNDASRVFVINASNLVSIEDLTVTHGEVLNGNGGAIWSEGDLTLERVVVSHSLATVTSGSNGWGGGVYSQKGDLTIIDSSIEHNDAYLGGGVVKKRGGTGETLEIIGSTIAYNRVDAMGGEVHAFGGGLLVTGTGAMQASVVNSTISHNAARYGAGITIRGNSALVADIVNSTIAHNDAFGVAPLSGEGGIRVADGATVTLHNTIVALNTSNSNSKKNFGGGLSANSTHNLLGTQTVYHSFPTTNGNQVGVSEANVGLAPLGDYGGLTQTHALLPASYAINNGNNSEADDASGSDLPSDQRGTGYPRVLGTNVDVGAMEANVVQTSPTAAITVYGSDGADGISVGKNTAGNDVVAIDSVGGFEFSVSLAAAASVIIHGYGGDDAIVVDSSITKNVELRGGDGEDLLQGGDGNDKLVGGSGADVLVGGDGNDNLYGSDDASVVLDDGADTLFGDAGSDTLHVDYFAALDSTLDPDFDPDAYTPVGGDVFVQEAGDTVSADDDIADDGYAPLPTGSTWQQGMLWNGNYGFGAGWNVAGIDRLEFTGPASAPTTLKWVRADGHTVTMTRQSTNDPWTAVSGDPSASEITYNTGTQKFTRTDKHGNVSDYLVAATGLAMVVRTVDRLGVGRKYAYSDHDSNGTSVELDSITLVRTGQVDEVINYNYSTVTGGHQRITSIVDPFGRTTTIEYNSGKVSSVKLPNVIASSSEVNDNPRFRISGNPTTSFTYDSNGFVNQIIDADAVERDFNWKTNGELWVEDADPNPIRYLGAPSGVYTQWMEKTHGWQSFLPAFLLTDGLAGMGSTDVKQGYAIDEAGRTTKLHYNRDGGIVERQDPTGTITEITRTAAGLPDDVTVKAPGDERVVDQISYNYDSSHNLILVTNFDVTQSSWDYDPTFSQLIEATDELGRRTVFSVNATNGNTEESRIIVGLDDRSSSETNDVVTQYAYTADGLVSQVVELRNDIDGSAQTSLVAWFFHTDTNSTTGTGHNSRRWNATVYGGDDPTIAGISFIDSAAVYVAARDDYDNPTEVIDEVGRSTFYQYDVLDRLILEHTDDPGFGQLVAAVEYDYSLGNRLGAKSFGTIGGGSGSFGGVASAPITDEYLFDACDCPDLTSLDCWNFQDGTDGAMHYEENYNADGTLGSLTGPDGRTTVNIFGPRQSSPVRKQLSGQSGYGGSGGSSIEGVNDTLYLYNARNELIAMRDGAGVLTRYEYDEQGRLIRTLTGEGSRSESIYSDAGELVVSVDGEGRVTSYTYDDAGRMVTRLDPGHDDPTIYVYDSAGNLRTVTDPLGNTEEYLYDERSRVTEFIDGNDDSTTFTYYADNQRHTLTDAELNTTTWTYDNAGRVHTETNELNHTETYFYDEFNRLAEVEDRNGRIVRYTYDGRELLSEEWVASGATVREFAYTYRESPVPLGGTSAQVASVADTGNNYLSSADDVIYDYAYDDHGRLGFSQMRIGGLDVAVESVRSYDLGDRVIGAELLLDDTLDLGSPSQDGSIDHENSYAYDRAGRMAGITQSGPAVSAKHVELSYNRAGQFASIDRYASVGTTSPVVGTAFAYDQQGRLDEIAHAGIVTHGYGYDAADRLTSYINSAHSGESSDYTYDDRGQLLIETGENIEYTYDDNGNRVLVGTPQFTGGLISTIGDQNRLVEREIFNATVDYTYDDEGNRITHFVDINGDDLWSAGESGAEYTWDHRNRLTKVTYKTGPTGAATKTVDYQYDYLNQLVKRVEDPDGAGNIAAIDQAFYFYDKGQVALEFHQTGSGNLDAADLSHRYLWGPAVDQLFADEQITSVSSAGEVLWALTDHLGSVRDVVDSAGEVRIHRNFDAFGNIVDETHYNASGTAVTVGQTGFVEVVFAFTGRYLDPTTGLQNNLNRWYDPVVGRWLSEDPIEFDAGDPNLYRYVGNASTTRVDPVGLIQDEAPWITEKDQIIEKAREWFDYYKEHGEGWPNDNCEDQALDMADFIWRDLRPKHWEFRGVSGSRPRFFIWPPGYLFPRFSETENAVGVFPKGDNTCKPFVIDGFHDYDNNQEDITVYPEVDDFFDIWWEHRSRDSWNPKDQTRPKPPSKARCFAAGTLVMTESGLRRIETIRAGELVLTQHDVYGLHQTRVMALDVHHGEFEMLTLHADGGAALTVTKGHYFWSGDQWLPSERLHPGSRVMDYRGMLRLTNIFDECISKELVYNIQTEAGTYLVGEQGLLVAGVVPDQSSQITMVGEANG